MDALSKGRFTFHNNCSEIRRINVQECIKKWESPDVLFSFQTSGSTGEPKIVSFSREHILSSIHSSAKAFNFFKGMRSALVLETKGIGGAMMIFRAIVWEMNLQVLPVSRLINWEGRLNFLALVPQQAVVLNREKFKNVDMVLLGGAPIMVSDEEILKNMPSKIFHGFGMTETLTHFAIRRISPFKEDNYTCLKGVIVDSRLDGALVVSIKNLGISELYTTDAVKISKDGNSFLWLGRLDSAIISAGKKIYPEEVEKHVMNSYPAHPEGFAGVKKDDQWHEALVWFSLPLSENELKSLHEAFTTLPNWKRPKEVIQMINLPVTDSGKYRRR
ncbi:MAG: 2-succinylbenzoate--CoA ligase [Owenweeksia sp. TMED14]|nr:MAG: 2-succinylbenzoate--CoA ligase [Owenweeksia sp. TMED14]